ncbi:MAG TPA: hypothetical protein DD454_04500 [Candidatus Moranbacteria bacterium]|nr:hypothetical protein [Candidatus Moranbacteria bacterium]
MKNEATQGCIHVSGNVWIWMGVLFLCVYPQYLDDQKNLSIKTVDSRNKKINKRREAEAWDSGALTT